MRVQTNQAIHFGQAFDFNDYGRAFNPGELVGKASRVVTRNGRTTVRKQLFETLVVVAFVAELAVMFSVIG
ncbi:MAG: hypothetical protein WCF85_16545 [Rhodospirillaceae bacterium]